MSKRKKNADVPNKETMASIKEALEDMKHPHLKSASSPKELEDLLNK